MGTEIETFEIRTMSTTGNTIGSQLAIDIAVGTGAPMALVTVAGIAIAQGILKKK